jgi:hypothetical protein
MKKKRPELTEEQILAIRASLSRVNASFTSPSISAEISKEFEEHSGALAKEVKFTKNFKHQK